VSENGSPVRKVNAVLTSEGNGSIVRILEFSQRTDQARSRLTEDFVKKVFALEPGGPGRLTVDYKNNLASAEVLFDGQRVMNFASKEEFLCGTTCKLPDGSVLTVRFGPIEGVGFMKSFSLLNGVHVIHNGNPVVGSAADALPKWAWTFLVACGIIPVITLGGALPALLGFGGVALVLTVSRLNRWPVAARAVVSGLVTLACWTGLAMLVTTYAVVKAVNDGKAPVAAAKGPARSATDQLVHDIGVTYYKHGHLQSDVDKIKDGLYDQCDTMAPAQCTDYLRKELAKAQASPIVN
jgi:hypothetical protein